MAIKSREVSKFYIEQVLLDNLNNPSNWTEEQFNSICHNDKCIGYLFSTKEGVKFAPDTRVLNLYLIKPICFYEEAISLKELSDQWEVFTTKCIHETHHGARNVFRNPPIAQWIDTKENWCKKLAARIAERFGWSYDDSLSEVYYTVMKCYNKGHVYMGNLGYIQTAVYNNVRMALRFNKNRLNQQSGNCASLDAVINDGEGEDETITLADCVGYEDPHWAEMEYVDFEKEVKDTLSDSFSQREIEQIINQKAGYLPMNLYRRLTTWRKKHTIAEFM